MIQKTAVLPVVTVVLLILANVFGISFPDGFAGQVADVVVNIVALGVVVNGILQNHKK